MNRQRASQARSRRDGLDVQRDRRGFLTLLGGTGAALFAAACGGNANNAEPGGAATTAATRAAATTSLSAPAASTSTPARAAVATTPAAAVTGNQTVTYLTGDDAPEEKAWHSKYRDDFHAAFPQYRAEGTAYSSTDYQVKLQTALATNSPLDFLFRNSNSVNVLSLWGEGRLAPVNDVMEDVYKLAGGKDKFDQAAIDRYTMPTGEMWGVPFVSAPYVWWYRTDLLQEAGLTPPAGHWDWPFLLKAVKAVHKPPKPYGIALPLARSVGTQNFLVFFILNNGGHFLSPDLKNVVFDSPEVREAVDLYKELAEYTPPGATTWGTSEQYDAFVLGNTAMSQSQGRVLPNVVKQNPALITKIANTFPPYQKQPVTWGSASAHGIFKGKNLQATKELAKLSFQKDRYISYMLTTPGFYSATIPAYGLDPSYTSNSVLKTYDPKILATIADAVKNPYDLGKEGAGWLVNPKAGTLQSSLIMADVVQRVTVGKESTQSAVTWGAGQIRDAIKA